MAKMIKVTIDRSKWMTAPNKFGESLLLDGKGNMCCMGFLAVACGVSKEKLRGKAVLNNLAITEVNKLPKILKKEIIKSGPWPQVLQVKTKNFSLNGMAIEDAFYELNDHPRNSKARRESMLTQHFKEIGVTAKFVGKYAGEK